MRADFSQDPMTLRFLSPRVSHMKLCDENQIPLILDESQLVFEPVVTLKHLPDAARISADLVIFRLAFSMVSRVG